MPRTVSYINSSLFDYLDDLNQNKNCEVIGDEKVGGDNHIDDRRRYLKVV